MRVVLDTNILLVSLPRQSFYRIIFDKILSGGIELIISNEILLEYFEIISTKTNASIASNVAELLIHLPNVSKVDVYYSWNLIFEDASDNKFVDAALSGRADFIVSNDRHFDELKGVTFPSVKVLSLSQFMDKLNKGD